METIGKPSETGYNMDLFLNLTTIKFPKSFFQCSLCQKIAK